MIINAIGIDNIILILFLRKRPGNRIDFSPTQNKGDEVRVRRRMQRKRFVMPEGSTFDELNAARDADNIGERVDIALEAIENTNKAKLGGVFRNVSFNSATKLGETRDRNRRIKNLFEDFVEVHELAHGRHPNHGRAFFDLLSHMMPDWEKRKLALERMLA
jgi:type I restriction enzyme M protein